MSEKMKRILLGTVGLALILWLLGISKSSYEIGSGLVYLAKLEELGVTHEQAIERSLFEAIASDSKKLGVMFAAAQTASFAAFFSLILIFLAFSLNALSLTFKKTILSSIGILLLGGILMTVAVTLQGEATEHVRESENTPRVTNLNDKTEINSLNWTNTLSFDLSSFVLGVVVVVILLFTGYMISNPNTFEANPNTFEDCYLENIAKAKGNDRAAIGIAQMCRKKFPEKSREFKPVTPDFTIPLEPDSGNGSKR